MEQIKPFVRKLIAILNIIKLRTFLRHVEFEIVEHCNLNCKACSHFSNICEKKFVDARVIGSHFNKISKLFGFTYEACILGGEPLLHPDIIDIIEYTRMRFPFSRIKLVTNGLLLDKMSDAFFKSCHKNKIQIFVTKYPPIENKIEKIKELLYKFKIKYFISPVVRTFTAKLNPEGVLDKYETFKNCRHRECTMLRDDKIYLCPICAYIDKYNKYFNKNIPEPKGINIYSSSAKQILNYLKNPEETCKYCTRISNYVDWCCSEKPKETDWYGIQNGKKPE